MMDEVSPCIHISHKASGEDYLPEAQTPLCCGAAERVLSPAAQMKLWIVCLFTDRMWCNLLSRMAAR